MFDFRLMESIFDFGVDFRFPIFDVRCLESIFDATWRDVTYEVIYIDNGSKDGSADAVKEQFGDSVNLIANDTNLGFCPAGNQGARLANSRYLYFINDDTLVVDDAIALTVEYMDEGDLKLCVKCSRLLVCPRVPSSFHISYFNADVD